MTLWTSSFGNADVARTLLTTTSSTVVLPASKSAQSIGKIHICNSTGSAVTFDLEVFDGTTVHYLEKDRSLAANASFSMYDELLGNDASLRVKASAANALYVSVLFSLPQRG